MNQRLVIVGAGLACARLIQALRAADFCGPVTVIGDERHPPYDRPPLSKDLLINGTTSTAQGLLSDAEAAGTDWSLDCRARSLDTTRKTVVLANGTEVPYDTLVVATGCRARPLPVAPHLPTFRTVDDALWLRAALIEQRGRLLLIGAGFIGSEIAAASLTLGWDVAVVDAATLPLRTALGEHAARWLWQEHRANGIRTHFGQHLRAVCESGNGYRVRLDDDEIDADLVVVGIGTVPNSEWLHGNGLDTSDGVRTDRSLQALTTAGEPVDGVLAIGDIARVPAPESDVSARIEHWWTAGHHARIAADTILRRPATGRSAPPTFWTDFYHHRIQVIGNPAIGNPGDPVRGDNGFAIDFHDAGRLVGTVAVNWPARLVKAHRALTATEHRRPGPGQSLL